MCEIKSVPNTVQRGAAAQTGPQDWGEPQGTGAAQLSTSLVSERHFTECPCSWRSVSVGGGGTCCGTLQEGSSFFLLKGRIHDSALRRSPMSALAYVLRGGSVRTARVLPQNSSFTLLLRRRDCNISGNIFPPWGRNKYNRGLLCS